MTKEIEAVELWIRGLVAHVGLKRQESARQDTRKLDATRGDGRVVVVGGGPVGLLSAIEAYRHGTPRESDRTRFVEHVDVWIS